MRYRRPYNKSSISRRQRKSMAKVGASTLRRSSRDDQRQRAPHSAVSSRIRSSVIAGLDTSSRFTRLEALYSECGPRAGPRSSAIHPFHKKMDARVKPAHDGGDEPYADCETEKKLRSCSASR